MIPDRWEEVTLENYVGLLEVEKMPKETTEESLLYSKSKLMLLADCSAEEANKMPLSEAAKVANLARKPLPSVLIKTFELNGIVYKVQTKPHRLPSGIVEEVSADASIMNTGKAVAAINTNGDPKHWHRIIFLLCEPQKPKKFLGITYGYESYEFEPHEIPSRIEDFKKLSVGIAHPIAVFFCRVSREYLNHIQTSLITQLQQMEKVMQKSVEALQENGDG